MRLLAYRLFRKVVRRFSGLELRDRFPVVDKTYLRVNRALAPATAEVLGHWMYLDRDDSMGLAARGRYEPKETSILSGLVRSGDIALDLGANIGYYTLLLARLVGPEGTVYAFEPDPASFEILQRNVEENGYANVRLERRAAAHRSGEMHFYRSSFGSLNHGIVGSASGSEIVPIEAITLDGYFASEPISFGFVKMDIQGAEGLALEGMSQCLERSKRVTMLTEFWPTGLEGSGYGARQFVERLRAIGFSIYDVRDPAGFSEQATSDLLLEKYALKSWGHTNLLCIKGSQLPDLLL